MTTPSPLNQYDMLWVSRYSRPAFTLDINTGAGPTDVDDVVTAHLYTLDGEGQIVTPAVWTRMVPRISVGHYVTTLASTDTQVLGNYELQMTYEVGGSSEVDVWDFQIGPQSRTYDGLTPDWRTVVDGVWWKFQDLYDSPYGGPNLQVYVQTHFGRERLAMMLADAIQSMNTATQGNTNYQVNGTDFPFGAWLGVLQDSLYVEVLKHLVRSYVEQPEVILGTAVSRVDRRDYMQRWQEVLQGAQDDLKSELSSWKLANLGLGNVHVLVSGGAYGRWGPTAPMGSQGDAAARGYFALARFY